MTQRAAEPDESVPSGNTSIPDEALVALTAMDCLNGQVLLAADRSEWSKIKNGFASKVRKCAWTGSVQGAVATWSVISMRYFLTIVDSHDLTRSLPLPVLTRSKHISDF